MAQTIRKLGVIGAGQMGNGIAHVCALAGISVILHDSAAPRLKEALATINGNMARQVARKRITEEDKASALKRISTATLKRDVECCIRSYVPRLGSESPEEMSEPLLGELGLIQQNAKGTFEFRRGPKRSLPDGIFAYALLEYWKRQAAGSVMAFDRVAHDYGSPGRVFKLDEGAVADRLMALEALTDGDIQWTEQAGIRQVTRKGRALTNIDDTMTKVLRAAYGRR